jgi:hypothetical protein
MVVAAQGGQAVEQVVGLSYGRAGQELEQDAGGGVLVFSESKPPTHIKSRWANTHSARR